MIRKSWKQASILIQPVFSFYHLGWESGLFYDGAVSFFLFQVGWEAYLNHLVYRLKRQVAALNEAGLT